MEMTTRCKAQVEQVQEQFVQENEKYAEAVTLRAVTSNTPENAEWSKYTPAGSFHMQITNPSAWGRFTEGQEFYVDFIPCKNPL